MTLELQPITIAAIAIGSLALVILLIALTPRYGRVLFARRSPWRSESLAHAHAHTPHLSANRYSKSTFATLGGGPLQPRNGTTPTPTTAGSTLVGTPVSKLVKKTPIRAGANSPSMKTQGRRKDGPSPDQRGSQVVVVYTYEEGLRRLGLPPPDLYGGDGGGVSPVRDHISPASPVQDGLSPVLDELSRPSPRPSPGRAALGQWASEKPNRQRGEFPAGVPPMDIPPVETYPVGQYEPPKSPAQTMRSNWLPTYYFSSGVPADQESELGIRSINGEERFGRLGSGLHILPTPAPRVPAKPNRTNYGTLDVCDCT
ncbi:hypothetical protein JCM24511_01687 [Saitozyma sp. JCM 24511]|nr:hypothetical protein JCM24511_01687 [Saitozyma sp. JCM 24511]